MNLISLRLLSGLTLIAALVTSAQAQITFTVTATANATSFGYTAGSPYTFTFTTPSSYSNTASSRFTPWYDAWREGVSAEPQLWTSVGGTAVLGSFGRPSKPTSFVDAYANGALSLTAGNDASSGTIGLRTPNSGTANINWIQVQLNAGLPSFAALGSYGEPVSYFQSYVGTYNVSGGGGITMWDNNNSPGINFTPTALSITSAVPEPSTYAALAGLGAFAVAAYRRRRQRAV